jgi:hypothetical protein
VTATRSKKTTTTKGQPRKRARPTKAELQARAAKGLRTRRRNERARAKEHARRVEAGKKAYRTRLAKERARAALVELRKAVRSGDKSRRIDRVRDSWHKEKRALEGVIDDYDRYMAILEELSDDEAPDWDIAYGSTESAA